ncbi:MAG: hypothetical protein ACAI35_12280 [Candidatus Methylacidiphilales bacterium]|nr:hypothetical protein [Candidatus Methylacidiphilales bacterium]
MESSRCLRLFLSADLSGATDFKNKHQDYNDYDKHWARAYESFFKDFPVMAEGEWAKIPFSNDQFPEIWKCLGDEIIYGCALKSDEDCARYVRGFYRALRAFDAEFRVKNGLRLKGSAWSAGFPIRNTVLEIGGNSSIQDFVGPDMDIGFRLGGVTRSGRLAVSMDLADILSRRNYDPDFYFSHVGWEVLKGVFDGKPYPIIWVSEQDAAPLIVPPWEEHTCRFFARSQAQKTDLQKLRDVIKQVRDQLKHLELFPPYFTEDKMPAAHQDYWKKAGREQKQEAMDANQGPPDDPEKPSSST